MSELSNSLEAGQQAVGRALERVPREQPQLVLLFAAPSYDYGQVLAGIRQKIPNAPVLGCTAAAQYTESGVARGGVCCGLLRSESLQCSVSLATGLRDDPTACFQQAFDKLTSRPDAASNPFLIMLIDGLAGVGEEVALLPAAFLGPDARAAGASAADDYSFRETRVFANNECSSNALSMALLSSSQPWSIGVQHGHTPISKAFKITRAEGNMVYELDGRPAVDVWMESSRSAAAEMGIDVDAMWNDPDQLGRYTCIFEGGLETAKGYKVRWTGLQSESRDHLPFACTVPEGATMCVMKGTADSQISSAEQAARSALAGFGGGKIAGALVFDCAVRGAILGDDLPKAVEQYRNVLGDVPVLGCASYGEIALDPESFSGFHNTTSVVVLIPA
jgi:methyl-accepting chemotaxis protein